MEATGTGEGRYADAYLKAPVLYVALHSINLYYGSVVSIEYNPSNQL